MDTADKISLGGLSAVSALYTVLTSENLCMVGASDGAIFSP